jgi:intracellular septation protein
MPEAAWTKVLWSWVLFFVFAALLNLWVAHTVETSTWVNFKVFGLIGLTLVFLLGQGLYMARHLQDVAPHDASVGSPRADPKA